MKSRFTPHLQDLTFDAALRSFWRKGSLAKFLERSEIAKLPAWLPDESKRDYLSRLFEQLRATDRGKAKILQIAEYLAEQKAFPDLQGWEDSAEKLDAAGRSVAALKSYLTEQHDVLAAEENRIETRAKLQQHQARVRAAQQTLQTLSERLTTLSGDLGSSAAGREFEEWFYDLMQYSEIAARRPYRVDGREIDGSITIGDTTYLVECKFTGEQTGAPAVDIFRAKVETKADNTMGLLVSISGFSSVAITAASGRKTPLLLLDHGHVYRVLGGASSFRSVVERVRRHCSQTAQAYLPSSAFDG